MRNPFKVVWISNTLDNCYCELRIVRWRLWWMQRFGDEYNRHWVENARRTDVQV